MKRAKIGFELLTRLPNFVAFDGPKGEGGELPRIDVADLVASRAVYRRHAAKRDTREGLNHIIMLHAHHVLAYAQSIAGDALAKSEVAVLARHARGTP